MARACSTDILEPLRGIELRYLRSAIASVIEDIEAEKRTLKFGITVHFIDSKTIELKGRNGISCPYSARTFRPVVGFDFPDGFMSAQMRSDGVAEILIRGQRYEYPRNDPGRGMLIPEE